MLKDYGIPGSKAHHSIITDACRSGRGEIEAFREAARRAEAEYIACLNGGWREQPGVKFHLVLLLEKP